MPTITKRQTKRIEARHRGKHQGRRYYNENYHTNEWRAIRRQVLQYEPMCRDCDKKGVITLANVVDHIEPVRLGGEFWNPKNMQPLCTSCHNRKSAYESHGINRVGDEFYENMHPETAGHILAHTREKINEKR